MQILFSVTVFLSAFLLFLVQPMVGKNILPVVGGSPSAWNSCMLFFQILLLAGYAWAQMSVNRIGIKKQAIIQLILMATALLFLPSMLEINRDSPASPALWLIIELFKTVGMPFFVLSALSPLLQLWFASAGHQRSDNPYFLYATSNAGSFTALLVYPLVIEPFFSIQLQARLWSAGFICLFVLLLICRSKINPQTISQETSPQPAGHSSVTLPQKIRWCIAAFFPSSLLLAVTHFITTDLAPVPLLWVLPLMIYLVTFIIAFARQQISREIIEKLTIAAILLFPAGFFLITTNLWIGIPLHLFTLFAVSLMCHSYLAQNRPAVSDLTGFYTIISLGGMLGGLFNTILAPWLFTTYAEYPLLIIMTCFLLRRFKLAGTKSNADDNCEPEESISLSAIIGLYAAVILALTNQLNFPLFMQQISLFAGFDTGLFPVSNLLKILQEYQLMIRGVTLVIISLFPLFLLKKMPRLNLALFSLIVMSFLFVWKTGHTAINMARARNFFGTKMVQYNPQIKVRSLVHGTTVHGNQCIAADFENQPLTYFHSAGPIGSIFSLPGLQNRPLKVGVIGLGIGSLAAYSKPGDEFIFYEIDSQVIQLAQNPDLFTFLSNNAEKCRVVCGDGRHSIKAAPENYFDLIFFDAFSSGSIPVHLVTREAVDEYLQRLAPGGLLILNITNRYLNLKPVLSATAKAAGLFAITVSDNSFDQSALENFQRFQSEYVVFSRDLEPIKNLMETGKHSWRFLENQAGHQAWTDSHSSLLSSLNIYSTTAQKQD